MNFLFALIILVAYVIIHARKADISPLQWVKSNAVTTICAAVIVIGVSIVPKAVLEAVAAWYVTPILVALALKWGAVSVISNLFTAAGKWVSTFLSID